jgi:leader peptidase (prepilin peptidase) / N-methyltransferase
MIPPSWLDTQALGLLWPLMLFGSGAVIGSFLNVVGLRLLAEQSVVFPPSHCPQCEAKIRWHDNIPILSYVWLGAQCRDCKAPISIQYPLIELATAWLFVAVGTMAGLSVFSLLLLFLVVNLMVITITDWRESLIYEVNSLPLIPAGLLLNMCYPAFLAQNHFITLTDMPLFGGVVLSAGLQSALLGMLVGLVFFEGAIWLSKLAFKTDGFGHGDTQLMMGVGTFLGFEYTALALVLGFLLQTVWAIPLLVVQWIKQRQYVSLGTGAGAFTFAILPFGVMNNPGMDWLLWVCMLAAMGCLLMFLKQIRQQENYTYVPLGPALVAGSLISLFLRLRLPG